MKSYNGFTPDQRQKVSDIQKAAIKAGTWDYEKVCDMCGQTEGLIMFHNEDYNTPLIGYPLCVECHMKLHARYSMTNTWKWYCLMLRDGKKSTSYRTVYAYIQSNNGSAYSAPVDFTPDPTKWWEQLKLR